MKKIDGDSCDEAWDFYKKYYGTKLNGKTFIHNGKEIAIEGEVIFNTKLKRSEDSNTYTLFGSILREEECFNKLNKLLEEFHYCPMNLCVLPKTGGLNIIKGQFANDRFDSFVWLLSQYYQGITAPIINRGNRNCYIGQQTALSDFLEAFNDEKAFCKCFYGINNNLVETLIEKGPVAITKSEELYDYYLLACEFWTVRLEDIYSKESISKADYNSYTRKLDKFSKLLQDERQKILTSE